MSPSRAEQRQQTEQRILDEARRLFADLGFERTTIRAVATAAGVDAGLVMHYFGTKQDLFQRVTQVQVDDLPGDNPVEALLASLAIRLTQEPTASLAVLRSMLTNEDAAATYRTATATNLARLSAGISGPDATLRAALLTAITHGVVIERYLLRLGPLAEAPADQIVALLRLTFEALAPTPEPLPTEPLASEPLTPEPLPPQPLPAQPLPAQPLPIKPLTREPLTTAPLTTAPLTTAPLTTEALTPEPLMTEPVTPKHEES